MFLLHIDRDLIVCRDWIVVLLKTLFGNTFAAQSAQKLNLCFKHVNKWTTKWITNLGALRVLNQEVDNIDIEL
jgi:hypothetical protein